MSTLQSCDQKELCFDHWDHSVYVPYRLEVDWELDWEYAYPGGPDWQVNWPGERFGMTYDALRPVRPKGIRALVYHDENPVDQNNLAASGGDLPLRTGHHRLLFYNNDIEFVLINDISSAASATATTRGRSRSSYFGSPFVRGGSKEKTVNAPDPLFGHYIEDFTAETATAGETLELTMKPLVFTYLVRVAFDHGLEYVALARGALAGVAETVFLFDGHTGAGTATILYDFEITDDGLEAKVNSFGAPDYPNDKYSRSQSSPYGLNVEVRLKNGKIFSYDFDISRQMAAQPRGGVIEVGGISISDEDGKEDSGSFDVDVNGWGDFEDVPIVF